VEISPSTETEFSIRKTELMSLIKLAEKATFDNLYTSSKPVYRVVSNAFSISKNTAAVVLLLKLRVS
jgi:hypothetical protein